MGNLQLFTKEELAEAGVAPEEMSAPTIDRGDPSLLQQILSPRETGVLPEKIVPDIPEGANPAMLSNPSLGLAVGAGKGVNALYNAGGDVLDFLKGTQMVTEEGDNGYEDINWAKTGGLQALNLLTGGVAGLAGKGAASLGGLALKPILKNAPTALGAIKKGLGNVGGIAGDVGMTSLGELGGIYPETSLEEKIAYGAGSQALGKALGGGKKEVYNPNIANTGKLLDNIDAAKNVADPDRLSAKRYGGIAEHNPNAIANLVSSSAGKKEAEMARVQYGILQELGDPITQAGSATQAKEFIDSALGPLTTEGGIAGVSQAAKIKSPLYKAMAETSGQIAQATGKQFRAADLVDAVNSKLQQANTRAGGTPLFPNLKKSAKSFEDALIDKYADKLNLDDLARTKKDKISALEKKLEEAEKPSSLILSPDTQSRVLESSSQNVANLQREIDDLKKIDLRRLALENIKLTIDDVREMASNYGEMIRRVTPEQLNVGEQARVARQALVGSQKDEMGKMTSLVGSKLGGIYDNLASKISQNVASREEKQLAEGIKNYEKMAAKYEAYSSIQGSVNKLAEAERITGGAEDALPGAFMNNVFRYLGSAAGAAPVSAETKWGNAAARQAMATGNRELASNITSTPRPSNIMGAADAALRGVGGELSTAIKNSAPDIFSTMLKSGALSQEAINLPPMSMVSDAESQEPPTQPTTPQMLNDVVSFADSQQDKAQIMEAAKTGDVKTVMDLSTQVLNATYTKWINGAVNYLCSPLDAVKIARQANQLKGNLFTMVDELTKNQQFAPPPAPQQPMPQQQAPMPTPAPQPAPQQPMPQGSPVHVNINQGLPSKGRRIQINPLPNGGKEIIDMDGDGQPDFPQPKGAMQ